MARISVSFLLLELHACERNYIPKSTGPILRIRLGALHPLRPLDDRSLLDKRSALCGLVLLLQDSPGAERSREKAPSRPVDFDNLLYLVPSSLRFRSPGNHWFARMDVPGSLGLRSTL